MSIKHPRGSAPIRTAPAPTASAQDAQGGLSIELPLPTKGVSPNGRGKHWGAKARAVASYRQTCAYFMRNQGWGVGGPIEGAVRVNLDFYLCHAKAAASEYCPRDEDNARAAMKAAQDALKDVGVVAGDSKKYLRVGTTTLYTTAKEHQGRACVVLTLEPIEEANE